MLPALIGQPVDAATAALAELQLTLVPAGQQFSETAPAGTIMAFTVGGLAVRGGRVGREGQHGERDRLGRS